MDPIIDGWVTYDCILPIIYIGLSVWSPDVYKTFTTLLIRRGPRLHLMDAYIYMWAGECAYTYPKNTSKNTFQSLDAELYLLTIPVRTTPCLHDRKRTLLIRYLNFSALVHDSKGLCITIWISFLNNNQRIQWYINYSEKLLDILEPEWLTNLIG